MLGCIEDVLEYLWLCFTHPLHSIEKEIPHVDKKQQQAPSSTSQQSYSSRDSSENLREDTTKAKSGHHPLTAVENKAKKAIARQPGGVENGTTTSTSSTASTPEKSTNDSATQTSDTAPKPKSHRRREDINITGTQASGNDVVIHGPEGENTFKRGHIPPSSPDTSEDEAGTRSLKTFERKRTPYGPANVNVSDTTSSANGVAMAGIINGVDLNNNSPSAPSQPRHRGGFRKMHISDVSSSGEGVAMAGIINNYTFKNHSRHRDPPGNSGGDQVNGTYTMSNGTVVSGPKHVLDKARKQDQESQQV